MNKYIKKISTNLFEIFLIIFITGIISGVFLFIPFLISSVSLLLLIKNKNKKNENIKIDNNNMNGYPKITHYKSNYPIKKYSKNKVKIKKRIKY